MHYVICIIKRFEENIKFDQMATENPLRSICSCVMRIPTFCSKKIFIIQELDIFCKRCTMNTCSSHCAQNFSLVTTILVSDTSTPFLPLAYPEDIPGFRLIEEEDGGGKGGGEEKKKDMDRNWKKKKKEEVKEEKLKEEVDKNKWKMNKKERKKKKKMRRKRRKIEERKKNKRRKLKMKTWKKKK